MPMLSVIIPTEGKEPPVVATLAALVPGVTAGLIQDVVLVDRGDTDTVALAAGVKRARAPWLMFLHPGTVPDLSWIDETAQFIDRMARAPAPRAAILRYARSPYADQGVRATAAHILRLLSGPSPDQGLVIARRHFEALGGYPAGRRDAERTLLRKLGRARLMLRSRIMVPG
jgi:hypothetical protein